MVEAESIDRVICSIAYQINTASFPIHRNLDGFDFSQLSVDAALIARLVCMKFTDAAENIVLVDGSGSIKSHLSIALEVTGIQIYVKSVHFYFVVELVNRLEREKAASKLVKLAFSLMQMELVILNELYYLPFSQMVGALLFHLLSRLNKHTTGVLLPVCSNFISPFAWKKAASLLLVSDAFAEFRCKALVTVGGFDPHCLVEDCKLIHRMRRYVAEHELDWQVRVIGNTQARTSAPSTFFGFLQQHRRTASFTAGVPLLLVGVTISRVRNRKDQLYALIPMLFAIQQLIEGALWLIFPDKAPLFKIILTYAYSVFSHVLWPMYIPIAVFF